MVLKMKIKKLLVELVDAVELVGNPRKCLETTRGCAVVPGGHEPSHEPLSWELTWRLGRGTRGGTFIIPPERTIAIARIQHIGVGTRGGAFIVPRERSKRTRTCLLQGTTIATARIQTGLYIMLSEAARVDQDSPLRIFVVCKPHVRSHVGEHDQPAQMCFFTSAVQIDKKMVASAPSVPTTSTMPP